MHNIWKLYLIRFFQGFIPAYVIERLFWEQRGMTIQLVIYTEIIYAITILLLEVPTGILSDRWGRKKMLLVSAFLACFEFLLLLYATQFWHFALVVIFAGVSNSFLSGTENAFLYESLQQNKKEHLFEKHLGLLEVCQIVAALIAALSGSLLAIYFSLEFNYQISFLSMVAVLWCSFTLQEPIYKQHTEPLPSLFDYVRQSVFFFRSHTHLFMIVLTGIVIGASLNFVDEFWQLYLSELSIPISYFGLFSACCMLLHIPGNLLAPFLQKYYSQTSILLSIQVIFVIGFTYIALIHHFTSLLVIGVIFLASGVVVPIVTGYMHHQIRADMRATIDSFQSLGQYVAIMVIGLGFSYFTKDNDIFGGFGFIGGICMLYFIYFCFISWKNSKE
jgi:predicted MFS family arabinose efflux permease